MPTFATPEPIAVRIEGIEGHIRLVASDRADTVVQVVPRDSSKESDVWAAEHTRVDFRDGKLMVSGAKRGLALFRHCATEVEIELPARSRVHASLGSADLRAAVRRAMETPGPVLLDVAANPNELSMPPKVSLP